MFLASSAVQYSLRVLCHLAAQGDGGRRFLVREVAGATGLPPHFLRQVMRDLARGGLLGSRKGPGGGFWLARPAAAITLYDVLVALGEAEALERCAVGFARCDDDQPCPLHDAWRKERDRVRRFLEAKTIADLARTLAPTNGRAPR